MVDAKTKTLMAVILCGGLGTRLRRVIGDVPKVLAPVAGRPFLDYQMRYLKHSGITEVVLCTGVGGDQVADYCGDGSRWGLGVHFSRESEPLGTGGALKNAQPLLNADRFLVLNGDSFITADLGALLSHHTEKQAGLTLLLTEVPDRSRFGAVTVDEDGLITSYGEKGRSGPGFINAGIYVVNRSVLDEIPAGRFVSLEQEIFPALMGRGMYGVAIPGFFLDIGTAESYAGAERFLAAGLPGIGV